MSDGSVKRLSRRYDNSGRAVQAAANRAAVLEAAAQLLIDKGYSQTTMAAVARLAGVSVETVYKTFGNKPALVREVLGAAVVGDDEPVALMDRPDMQAALHAPTGAQILLALVQASMDILARLGPLLATLLVAARAGEPELREIAAQAGQQRLTDLTRVIDAVAATGDLRADLDVPHAADVLWRIGSPEVYLQLTVDRGWTVDEYQTWLAETLQTLLLRGPLR
ncbi:MAG: TetR/AcrR family transcriptional regulator [Propionibacteriaceae bacterium]